MLLPRRCMRFGVAAMIPPLISEALPVPNAPSEVVVNSEYIG
jgi:hypothetical protein